VTDPTFPLPLAPIEHASTPRRRWIPILAVVVVLVLVAVVTAIVVARTSDDGNAKWDPILAPYVRAVERDRGLEFTHPVTVVYLDDAAFKARISAGVDELDEEDIEDLERAFAALRALGLTKGEYDLEQVTDATARSVAAFFDPETDQIVVPDDYRDADLDPYQQSVIVHELTHALQDQHFDLEAIFDSDEAHETVAGDALIEGDASSIENMFISRLDASGLDAYVAAQNRAAESAQSVIDEYDLPPAFTLLLQVPYATGPSLVWMLRGADGVKRLNDAFGSPPTADRDALNPAPYVYGDPAPLAVTAPPVPAGASDSENGAFGALMLMAMLNNTMTPRDAMTTADAWGGDHYVMYRDAAGTECIDVALRGTTDDATDAIAKGLAEWATAIPGAIVRTGVTPDGAPQVDVHSCDPGAAVTSDLAPVDDLLFLLTMRSQLFTSLMSTPGADADAEVMWCVVNTLLDAFTAEELRALATGDPTSSVVTRAQQVTMTAMDTCAD